MGKMAILCVDDEAVILYSLKSELANLWDRKYRIEFAENGTDAIEIFTELIHQNYDTPVVISDYIMPGMKGDELLARIHQLSPSTLTIMLTGQAALEGITNAINHAGLFCYLEKPLDKAELRAAVLEAAEAYYRKKELAAENQNLLHEQRMLEEKARQKTLELETIQSKVSSIEKMALPGPMTENVPLFKDLGGSLAIIKAHLDSLGRLSATADMNWIKSYLENETSLFEANNQALAKIIHLIQNIPSPAESISEESNHE